MANKWSAIFWIVFILTVTSCTAYENYNDNQYKIAQLECQDTKE